MESFDISNIKIRKNWMKNNIKKLFLFNNNLEEKFRELIINNLDNDDGDIKYIIKILLYYIKNDDNKKIKNRCYELFMLLLKNITKNNIILNLTSILLFLQENISFFEIHTYFEIVLNKLINIDLKYFEILNGFCLLNIKNNENKIQKEAFLCYNCLLKNFENLIYDNNIKENIIKSFLETLKLLLDKKSSFKDRVLLLNLINDIISISREKSENYIEYILYNIINDLSLNDDNIKIIILNIIKTILKYNHKKKKLIKEIIEPYFIKLNNDKSSNNLIKRIIYDINGAILEQKMEPVKLNKINSNRSVSRKYIRDEIINRNRNSTKNFETDFMINKNKKNKKKKKNINIEIFVKPKKINNNKKFSNKRYIPINKLKTDINENENDSISFNNFGNKLKIPGYRNNDSYENPIKLWYYLDTNNSIRSKNKETEYKINIDNSINNNNFNIINQTNEESKLDLIMNEITKLSNNQNIIAEKIAKLDKNTQKQISYFNERLEELENKDFNKDLINKIYRFSYPSNPINKKIIEFINTDNNDISIYIIKGISEYDIKLIDNYLIEDVIGKLLNFIQNKIYIKESVDFILKLSSKKRLKNNIIKKLLFTFDLIKDDLKLDEQISFDISKIISYLNIK